MVNKKTVVEFTLKNPLDESEIHNMYIIPKDASIGEKWIKNLKICLSSNLKVEKNFCWVGWPDAPRNLEYLTARLMGFIQTINDYNNDTECKWTETYYITEYFDPSTVMTSDLQLNHDIFNRLHHHFEVLQGQVWDISTWFINADNETRYAIRQLNNFCHEMEILIKQIRAKKLYPKYVSPAAIVAFINGPREELEPEDYAHFTLQRGGGRVYLGYCQIGKTHWEAFVDGDAHISDGGISGLRYASGEVTIDFAQDSSDRNDHQMKIKEYEVWLANNGLSIDDKQIGHGWLHVATIDYSQYEDLGMSMEQIQEFLSKFLDIYKISIIEDGVVVATGTYDYHWNKPGFELEQKEALFKTYNFNNKK